MEKRKKNSRMTPMFLIWGMYIMRLLAETEHIRKCSEGIFRKKKKKTQKL